MNRTLVLPPTRRPGLASGVALVALIVVSVAGALLVDPRVSAASAPATLLIGLLIAGTLGAFALALARGHGALWLEAESRRLGFAIRGPRDIWWLPADRLSGLRLQPLHTNPDTIERWLLTIDLHDAPEIVLGESDDRAFLRTVGTHLAAHLAIPFEEGLPRPDEGGIRPSEMHFGVRRGAAMQGQLLAFGASLIALGVLALSALEREPVAGFIFGPVLLVMGCALAAVSLVKRLAREHLTCDGTSFSHAFTLLSWRWAERTVRAPHPRFRIRLHGLRGATLELHGEDGVLDLASGATARSRMSLPEVAAIPACFRAAPPS